MKDRFCPLNVDSVVPGNWVTAIFGTGMTLTSGKGEGELALLVTTSTGCKTRLKYVSDQIPCCIQKITLLNSKFHFVQLVLVYVSRVMRKPTLCIYENKDADRLRGNREADQRLCFRYIDSTIPLVSKSEISSL